MTFKDRREKAEKIANELNFNGFKLISDFVDYLTDEKRDQLTFILNTGYGK